MKEDGGRSYGLTVFVNVNEDVICGPFGRAELVLQIVDMWCILLSHVYVCIHVCQYVCMFVSMYVFTYVCTHLCV